MRRTLVALLVLAAPLSGCMMLGLEPAPISANEAYDQAQDDLQRNMERNGQSEITFVAAIGVEGAPTPTTPAPKHDDMLERAGYDLAMADANYGTLGDGVTGGWVMMFILSGADNKNAAAIHVAPPPNGGGVTIVGQDGRAGDSTEEPDVGPFEPCVHTDVSPWKVSSQDAARTARESDSVQGLVSSRPDGWYHYQLLMDDGFLDGCDDDVRPVWEVSYVAPDGDTSQVASVTIDATTGDVLDQSLGEVAFDVADGVRHTLLDATQTFTNPVPCDLGCGTAGDDPEVGRFELATAAEDVEIVFTLEQTGQTVFADNCRLWRGEGETHLVEQAAFNGSECTLRIDSLVANLYRAVFSTDELDPTGTHKVHVVATAVLTS